MLLDNEDSDPQYSIIFEYNYHSEVIINYELVEVNNEEQELARSDHTNEELDVENSKERVEVGAGVE
ncbi:16154_t:CDS:1, partial [Racocetra persica]